MTGGRRTCRSGHPCDPHTLGEALYCLVHHSDLDARAIAEQLGVRYGYLLDAANPDRDDTQFQARWLVPLTLITGREIALQRLAQAAGGVYFALPQVADDAHRAVVEYAGVAASDFGALMQRVGRALDPSGPGGVDVTPAEADQVAAEVDRTIAALMRVKAVVTSLVVNRAR